jgi:hypothetical protein
MSDEPRSQGPEPESVLPESVPSDSVPPEDVPPPRVGGRAGEIALGSIVFLAALLLLLGTTRLLERGDIASAPTAGPSSSGPPSVSLSPVPTGSASPAPSGSPGPSPSGSAGGSAAPTGSRSPGPTAVASGDPILVGAGDIGNCASDGDEATGALLDGIGGTVFTAGDNAYPSGSAQDFRDCYGSAWGRQLQRTRPAPGNHDWVTGGLAGYRGYFGAAAQGPDGSSWYSYDLGAWHVIVLDSSCAKVGGCGAASPQGTWLAADLAADHPTCTLAIFHHPRFSSGEHGNQKAMDAFWRPLYAAGVDLIVNGHDHDYERFAPQDPGARLDDAQGIREFVVGTGGTGFRGFGGTAANSDLRIASVYGVLALTLHPAAYDWVFIGAGNELRDRGTASCH